MTTQTDSQSATERSVRLKDGRDLAYAEYGDPAGKPVLYFHGWPSSRLEAWAYDEPGKKVGARVIGIDRPGIGRSTFKKGYGIADWPSDVAALADALGIERFAVTGISSGAPYSLVCARFIPERLTGCAVVSGLPPLDGPEPEKLILKDEIQIARLARRLPFVAGLVFRFYMWRLRRDPEKAMEKVVAGMPESDRDVMSRPEIRAQRDGGFAETMRQGVRGPLASVALEVQPWGFALEEITIPVTLWHGEKDNLAFPASAALMHDRLPHSTLRMIPEAGHLTVVVDHAEDVLRGLLTAD